MPLLRMVLVKTQSKESRAWTSDSIDFIIRTTAKDGTRMILCRQGGGVIFFLDMLGIREKDASKSF